MTNTGKTSKSGPGARPSQPLVTLEHQAGERQASYHIEVQRPSERAIARPPHRPAQGDKREQIVNAALELFVERGFYGTAVPEIADRAGVGAGTIYRYFESKEALVNAIYRELKLQFSHVVLDDFPASAPTREQFRMLWTRMAKFAVDNTNAFIFLELHHHARYLDAESRAVEQRMTGLITHVVTASQARGDLKAASPRLLMGIVIGAFVGVIRSCIEVDESLASADWVLAERCCWEAIRN
jgi:AcrR family transcriptional regulator